MKECWACGKRRPSFHAIVAKDGSSVRRRVCVQCAETADELFRITRSVRLRGKRPSGPGIFGVMAARYSLRLDSIAETLHHARVDERKLTKEELNLIYLKANVASLSRQSRGTHGRDDS